QKATLLPPKLSVVLGARHSVNAYCISSGDESATVLVGGGLYEFIHYYTRTAAAFFLPSTPGGARPSDVWPKAKASFCTTLDWISSPVRELRYPTFKVTAQQRHAALAL